MLPILHNSVENLHAVCLQYETASEELFCAFKMAGRGALRKGPNVLSWVVGLKKLVTRGESDPASVLARWNKAAARQQQITGVKAQAVKNLLSIDECAFSTLLRAVSDWGWDGCPYSEDALSSKKIFPGRHFRCASSKSWTDRQEVTKDSMKYMFEHVNNLHSKKPNFMQKKLPKLELESLAEAAAIMYNLGKEMCVLTPVTVEDMQTSWCAIWAGADPKVVAELTAVVALKDPKFVVHDVPTLASLINQHTGGQDICVRIASDKLTVDQANLEASLYEHLKKQLNFDCQQFRVYIAKIQNHSKVIYSQKLAWDLQQHQNAKAMAEKFMHDKVLAIEAATGVSDNIYLAFNKFVRETAELLQLEPKCVVPC